RRIAPQRAARTADAFARSGPPAPAHRPTALHIPQQPAPSFPSSQKAPQQGSVLRQSVAQQQGQPQAAAGSFSPQTSPPPAPVVVLSPPPEPSDAAPPTEPPAFAVDPVASPAPAAPAPPPPAPSSASSSVQATSAPPRTSTPNQRSIRMMISPREPIMRAPQCI